MGIDWLTALSQADNSLESSLARRDVSKMQQMLAGLAQEAASQKQFSEDMDLRRKALQEQTALRIEQQLHRRQQDEMMNREREADNKRGLYSNLTSGRKPGDRIAKQGLDVISEFEGGTGDYTADPNDPLQFIYKQAEAERLLAEAQSQEKVRQAQEARAQEDQKLQRESADRDRKRLEMSLRDEERRQKRLQMAVDNTNKKVETLPPHLRPAVGKRAEELMEELRTLNPFDDEDINSARAWAQAAKEVEAEARKNGQMPPGASSPAPQIDSGGGYLSDEEVRKIFPNLPPGTKVRRKQ